MMTSQILKTLSSARGKFNKEEEEDDDDEEEA